MVIDASVATKWFLKENDSSAALELLRTIAIFSAPAIIEIEVAAAISKAVRLNIINSDTAYAAQNLWQERLKHGTVQLEALAKDRQVAFRLSVEIKHSLQDCLYLATAKRLATTLLTTDEKQFKKAAQVDIPVKRLAT